MSWNYEQATGKLSTPLGEVIGIGYSGYGEGKNNAEMQDIHDIGPIPLGRYSIGAPHDTVTHGPFVLPLYPHPENEMFNRDGFLIHGDSKSMPGTASHGCIIMARDVREAIARSMDKELLVTGSWVAPDVDGEISGAGG